MLHILNYYPKLIIYLNTGSSLISTTLIALLVIAVIVQLYYILFIFNRAVKGVKTINKKQGNIKTCCKDDFLSVIIAAKNEAENLNQNLKFVLTQDYPNFEVIVVNDGSNDNSMELLKEFANKFEHLKIVNIPVSKGKKQALTEGIKKSKGNLLVFTDADCFPASNKWLKVISSKFSKDKEIIIGYGAYIDTHTFLSRFIAYDSMYICMQYFGAALMGVPYMGVGRNIAYKKSLWEKVNGFNSHIDIISGDDDLFITSAANSSNIDIVASPQAKTYSNPEKDYKSFINQKLRHLSTTKKYKLRDLLISGGEMSSRILLYLITIILAIKISSIFLIIIALRLLIISFLLKSFALKVKDKIKFCDIIFFDIFAITIYLKLWFYKVFIKKTTNAKEKRIYR